MNHQDLIHDWNGTSGIGGPVGLIDATLSEGLASGELGAADVPDLCRLAVAAGPQFLELPCDLPQGVMEEALESLRDSPTRPMLRLNGSRPEPGLSLCRGLGHKPAVLAEEELEVPDLYVLQALGRELPSLPVRGVLLAEMDRILPAARRLGPGVELGWCGLDRAGLGVAEALQAVRSGCRWIRGTVLGLGDLPWPPLDLVAVNLHLEGLPTILPGGWAPYVEGVAAASGRGIPADYPVFGADAFRTATGVHAAAILKARKLGDEWLADHVYSGVPAGTFGRGQVIEVGPMSGRSNAVHWLRAQNLAVRQDRIDRLMAAAKKADRVLTDLELLVALEEPQLV